MTRKELIDTANQILAEHFIEDETYAADLADTLDEEFGLFEEEPDDDEEEEF